MEKVQEWVIKQGLCFLDITKDVGESHKKLEDRIFATEGKQKLLLYINLPEKLRPSCGNSHCDKMHNHLIIYNAQTVHLESDLSQFQKELSDFLLIQKLALKSKEKSPLKRFEEETGFIQALGIKEFSDITTFLHRNNEPETIRKQTIGRNWLALYGLCPPYLVEEFLPPLRNLQRELQGKQQQKEKKKRSTPAKYELTEEEKLQDMYFIIYQGKYLPIFLNPNDALTEENKKEISDFISSRQVKKVGVKRGHSLKCPCCKKGFPGQEKKSTTERKMMPTFSAPLDLIREQTKNADLKVGDSIEIDGQRYVICSQETARELGVDI
jgi:hypothetical protein